MPAKFSREQLLNSPSRKDGLDYAKECQLRNTYTTFIKRLVQELKLPSWTLESAVVYTHRFFAARSISKNDRFLLAAASVFLACKVDECPRGLRDVAYVYIKVKNANKPAELESLRSNTDAVAQPVMENILLAERALLYTLAFDLNIDHMYSHVTNALKKLALSEVVNGQTSVVAEARPLFQNTVNMLNDSLKTTLCLEFEASTLVAAVMIEVAKLIKYTLPIPQGTSCTDFFSITQTEIDDIMRQLSPVYGKPKAAAPPSAPSAPPQLSDLLQAAKATGPPLPTFRPVILTDSPVKPQPQMLPSSSLPEEGELPSGMPSPSGGPAKGAAVQGQPPVASASETRQAGATAQACGLPSTGRAEARTPGMGDSDMEQDVGHAPGSGDQNNHNEPTDAASVEQQQPSMSRKRTRSPGALEDGELQHRQKSPYQTHA